MSVRSAGWWLAWFLAGLSLVMAAASVALYFLARPTLGPGGWVAEAGELSIFAFFLAFPIVGALISSRQLRNPIGWLCLADGLLWMLLFLIPSYSAYGLASPGSVPFPVTINALGAWLWVPAVGLIGIYLPLLFPDGRPPSRRWRTLAWLAGVVVLLESVAVFLTPGPLDGLGGLRNPFGLEGQPWLEAASNVFIPLLPMCMVASAASLVLRFRRSGFEVRQQIKWIALAASFVGFLYLAIMCTGLVVWLTSPPGTPTELGARTLWGALLENLTVLSFAGIPVAIGFAVLKYRLYDIDVLINRALVYGTLTVALGLVYFGTVVLLGGALQLLVGEETQLAVVASTLTVAAMFGPLRRRLQGLIDRRFYRAKYDAAKTLESFSARLRDETDLDALGEELVGVVTETMRPAQASLWLREPRARG